MGPMHPSTINALQSLSTLLIDMGRGVEAEELMKCDLTPPFPLPASHQQATCVIAMPHAWSESHRSRIALRIICREEVAATRAAYGPRHAEHQRAVLDFVKLLCSIGKPDVAEGVLREALGMLSATAGPKHVDTLRLAAQLALLLREMGRGAAAEPIYRWGTSRARAQLASCAAGPTSIA